MANKKLWIVTWKQYNARTHTWGETITFRISAVSSTVACVMARGSLNERQRNSVCQWETKLA